MNICKNLSVMAPSRRLNGEVVRRETLQIPRDLLSTPLRHTVVLLAVQIILHAGLPGQGDDVGFVGGVYQREQFR